MVHHCHLHRNIFKVSPAALLAALCLLPLFKMSFTHFLTEIKLMILSYKYKDNRKLKVGKMIKHLFNYTSEPMFHSHHKVAQLYHSNSTVVHDLCSLMCSTSFPLCFSCLRQLMRFIKKREAGKMWWKEVVWRDYKREDGFFLAFLHTLLNLKHKQLPKYNSVELLDSFILFHKQVVAYESSPVLLHPIFLCHSFKKLWVRNQLSFWHLRKYFYLTLSDTQK